MPKKKPAKKKRKQEPESDFYIPIVLPEIDPNKYLHKKKGFKPQDMEVKHKREKPETGIDKEIDLN